jgi:hypothetical protein
VDLLERCDVARIPIKINPESVTKNGGISFLHKPIAFIGFEKKSNIVLMTCDTREKEEKHAWPGTSSLSIESAGNSEADDRGIHGLVPDRRQRSFII